MRDNATEPQVYQDDDEIDLAQLFAVLWRGKISVFLIALLFLFAGGAYSTIVAPVYESDGLLQLEEKAGQLALPTSLSELASDDPRSATEIEIIQSRLVLGKVIADLRMDWDARALEAPIIGNAIVRLGLSLPNWQWLQRYARSHSSIRLDLLEVPPEWVEEKIRLVTNADGEFLARLPDGLEVSASVGETLRLPELGFAIRVGELKGHVGGHFVVVQRSEAETIEGLRDSIGVSEKGRQSGILALTLKSTDQEAAERILDAIMRSYLNQNIARGSAEAESSLEFVEKQIPFAEQKVRAVEERLNAYMQEQQSVNIELETQGLLSQVTLLESELREIARREDEVSERYTLSHPVYRQLLANRSRVEERLAGLRAEIDDLPATQRNVLNLQTELEFEQSVYLELSNRAQELRVMKASSIGNVRIVDTARVQPDPIAPRKVLIVALSLVMGLIVGAMVVLIRNWRHSGIRSAEEIERSGTPVLATVNETKDAEVKASRLDTISIFATSHPESVLTEALRSLRTSLHFSMLGAESNCIAVTSSAPGVGKSFLSVNLAALMAQSGQKVCLVDADMRRGYLRKYFGVDRKAPGLSEYLTGQVGLDDILVEGEVPGLFLIPAGRRPPNPADLLTRPSFNQLVDELNERFELSFFDTPPVLAVTDAALIGRRVGKTIGVVRHGVTPVGEYEAMVSNLKSGGVELLGAVLNRYDPRHAPAGKSYDYSYRYAYEKHD